MSNDVVSTLQLRALFTYWFHVCLFRFRRDNLVVDGRQMVSLVSVHGRALCFICIASLIFLMCQLHPRVSTLVFFMDTDCPVPRLLSPTPVGLSRCVCSLNLWLSVLLVSPTYVWLLSIIDNYAPN